MASMLESVQNQKATEEKKRKSGLVYMREVKV